MDLDRLDALAIALSTGPGRRLLLAGALLAALLLARPLESAPPRSPRRKRRSARKPGQPTSKKRKRCCPGLVKDGNVCTQPSPPPPPPSSSCPPGGCPANQHLPLAGPASLCTVTCPSGRDPANCGDDLQAVLTDASAGDTVYVCPGRYRGNFIIDTAVRVIGAGDGPTSTSNTILDANGTGRALQIPSVTAGTVELERLRVTGGQDPDGPGILFQGTMLRMTACTVSGNTVDTGAGGGSILVAFGRTLEMLRCTVRDNHGAGAASNGGGIFSGGFTTLTDCLVEENIVNSLGGGLWINGGTTTLAGTTQVRGNEAAQGAGIYLQSGTLEMAATCRVTDNTATTTGGGIFRVAGTVNLAVGSLVCGNSAPTDPQCSGFSDAACQTTCPP